MVNNKKTKLSKDDKIKRKKKYETPIFPVPDVFDNKQAELAFNSLTKEEQDRYKKEGEYMYNNFNYNLPTDTSDEDSYAYILCGLRSGLSIEDLEEDETNFLKNKLGDDWVKKINIKLDELNSLNNTVST